MEIKMDWQIGLPKEDGLYVVTIKKENQIYTEVSYYSCAYGWESYKKDEVVAWMQISSITPYDCSNEDKNFKWVAKSDDGAFEDESRRCFATRKECYEDMRNHALEKMKWNTEYDDDFSDLLDDDYIGYEVKFKQDEIVHTSYSGVYTYTIVAVKKKFEITLPFQGNIVFDIEADSKEDAISKAMYERIIEDNEILQNLIYGNYDAKEIK